MADVAGELADAARDAKIYEKQAEKDAAEVEAFKDALALVVEDVDTMAQEILYRDANDDEPTCDDDTGEVAICFADPESVETAGRIAALVGRYSEPRNVDWAKLVAQRVKEDTRPAAGRRSRGIYT